MLRSCLLLSTLLLLPAAALADGEADDFVRKALGAKGAEYQGIRPRLLAEGEEVGAALARAAAEGKSPETRWLAESILEIRKVIESAEKELHGHSFGRAYYKRSGPCSGVPQSLGIQLVGP